MFRNKLNYLKTTLYSNFKRKFSHTKKRRIQMKMFLIPLFLGLKTPLVCEEESSNVLTMKDIVRGEYENKIRTFSSIEKRFTIFANVKSLNEQKMTYIQFLNSLVPFQYIKTKPIEGVEKELLANPNYINLMKKVDINGDGVINFEEYVILSVFMTHPIEDYKGKFPKGVVSKQDLCHYLIDLIYGDNSGVNVTNKSIVDGRTIKTDYNTLFKLMVEFIDKAFPNNLVKLEEIEKFKFDLNLLLNFFEFSRIPHNEQAETIPVESFARVLMSYVNIYKNKMIKKKIENKEIDLQGEVSFNQFVSFFWFLTILSKEKAEIFKNGIELKQMKALASEKIKKFPDPKFKAEIPERMLQVMIDLFDENKNGSLEFSEINDILKRRTFYSNSKNDFKEESRSVIDFFSKGIKFIKEQLWFLNK